MSREQTTSFFLSFIREKTNEITFFTCFSQYFCFLLLLLFIHRILCVFLKWNKMQRIFIIWIWNIRVNPEKKKTNKITLCKMLGFILFQRHFYLVFLCDLFFLGFLLNSIQFCILWHSIHLKRCFTKHWNIKNHSNILCIWAIFFLFGISLAE